MTAVRVMASILLSPTGPVAGLQTEVGESTRSPRRTLASWPRDDDTGEMELMNEPQVWTLIGVFATVMLGGMTLMTTFISRAMASAVGGVEAKVEGVVATIGGVEAKVGALRGEMVARFEALDYRFEGIDSRFDAVHSRFDAVETKIDHLDRDVTFLMRRAWGEPPVD
jgi:hypothetical protein